MVVTGNLHEVSRKDENEKEIISVWILKISVVTKKMVEICKMDEQNEDIIN